MAQAGVHDKIYDDGAMASTNTIYSSKFSGKKGSLWALHFVWAGSSPAGTFTLWESNLAYPDESDDSDWVQNTDVTFTDPAGSDSKALLQVGNSGARWIRVKYVNSSGSGTLQCYSHCSKGA